MTKTSRFALSFAMLAVLAAMITLACTAPPSSQSGAQTPGTPPSVATLPVAPPFSINHLMVAQIDHASHEIWDAATETGAPRTDEAWREVQHHAIQLAMAGPAIAIGGNGQADAGFVKLVGWKDYAQKMTDAGVAAFRATETKNMVALQAAGDALVETCNGCHNEFKPSLPSEGYLHPHYDGPPK